MRLAKLLILLNTLPWLLFGCSNYDVKLNERVVYDAQQRFGDYSLSDAALSNCVEETIKSNNIRQVRQLRILDCSDAGIASLAGLEAFTHLEQIDLRNNKLSQASELAELEYISVILIAGNDLESAAFLQDLPALQQADLNNNPKLLCESLPAALVTKLTLPGHCEL